MGDMRDLTHEMETVSDEAETRGLDMSEYTECGFPESHRGRVELAMNHWETGGYHLAEAVKVMKTITDEVEGPEHG
jgi:hypothetical protein